MSGLQMSGLQKSGLQMSSANVGSAKIKSANVASRLLLIDVPSSSECFRIMSEFDLQYSFSIPNHPKN
jgi:hypothetical protein